MENKYLSLLLVLAFISASLAEQVNNFDQPFTYECHSGLFLSSVISTHHNHYEDRKFYLKCRSLPGPLRSVRPTTCAWSDYTNGFDEGQVYQCPRNGYIAGMSSYHNNHHEDRRFKFYCCELPNTLAHSCYYTDFQNDFDEYSSFSVPYGKILRGMVSYHDNHHEDRRFKFQICDLSTVNPVCLKGPGYRPLLGSHP